MSEYTPTTDDIRRLFAYGRFMTNGKSSTPTGDRIFDSWLAAHDTEVRADEREKCVQDVKDGVSHDHAWQCNLSCVEDGEACECLSCRAIAAARGDGEQE